MTVHALTLTQISLLLLLLQAYVSTAPTDTVNAVEFALIISTRCFSSILSEVRSRPSCGIAQGFFLRNSLKSSHMLFQGSRRLTMSGEYWHLHPTPKDINSVQK
jgi:hypothetical protein